MRSLRKNITRPFLILLAYAVGILYSFPLIYMVLTSFKKESEVTPPSFIFTPTLENYRTVLTPEFQSFIWNSVTVTVFTILISVVLGLMAAYTIVFSRMQPQKQNNLFFWFVTTNLLPPVGVVVPIYLILKNLQMLDSKLTLILLYSGGNIPLVVWMVYSFLKEIPKEILEAASIDGSSRTTAFFKVILPLIKSGVASSALLVFVFTWNEFFFAVSFTSVQSSTIPVYMASFMTQQGLFWAKMSAISTIAVLPPIILGWLSQKAFVRGMTMGAVKG
ncbi:carbohydrate ABC transporter permease [Paenibacillus piri]|uniref:Carbohydrate ABC transporter permease n=1 Tax=Paenibacillus piri TaxID=2547395 RepID=A0A4R5KTR5_9BACL|nr:carbohydrate ABC transporter permease [Paenibacillus piri]TDF98852.1 carbohydrate ABC transporter permease [Paenibacillus piri]